jgi:nitrogen regulatory protein PII
MLKKIECFIQPSKLDIIRDALFRAGAEGLSVTDVHGAEAHLTRGLYP